MLRRYISVITRKQTINIGNEALSNELIRLIQHIDQTHQVNVLERAPKHLTPFTRQALPKDPIAAFEKINQWANRLASIQPVVVNADPNTKISLFFEVAPSKKF